MRAKQIIIVLLILLVVGTSSCRKRDRGGSAAFDRTLAPGEQALQLINTRDYPRFSMRHTSVSDLRKGIKHSMSYLRSPSAAQHFPINGVRKEQVIRGLQKFDSYLHQHPRMSDRELNDYIRRHFTLYRSVGYDRRGSVLFTGYYTPIFKASKQRHGPYQFPLYKRPHDLVSGKTGKEMSHRRLRNGGLEPYPSRAVIERTNMLRGTELIWLTSAIDAFIIHVQGSARVRLENGQLAEIGYNGTNGHDYVSVGLALVADGHFKKHELSLEKMRAFFARNPHFINRYINKNPRFVFFKYTDGGPFGSLGPPVTTDISIATDKSIFPRGALCWVQAPSTDQQLRKINYGGFRLDQDTGGAIRAPGKCDLYMGVGAHAEKRAGRQMATGQLFYLVAK